MSNSDYYSRSEVSNSDLTALKEALHPMMQYGDREAAFRFGSIVDAMVTEPERVDYIAKTVDGQKCIEDEFLHACEMHHALMKESLKDDFLRKVLDKASTQTVMVRQKQQFEYCEFNFHLDTRCKWDWYLGTFGGDLKTTSAATQKEFDEAVDHFDWDRSRAFYMDIAGSDYDFIYAISKKNCKVFKKFIDRKDKTYERGKDKYSELAFYYWMLG